jgi:hypothetical protein
MMLSFIVFFQRRQNNQTLAISVFSSLLSGMFPPFPGNGLFDICRYFFRSANASIFSRRSGADTVARHASTS